MIEPIRITDEVDVVSFVEGHFASSDDPLFIYISYNKSWPNTDAAFVLDFGMISQWDVIVHRGGGKTPEQNLECLKRRFPQFLDWYLFHPQYL